MTKSTADAEGPRDVATCHKYEILHMKRQVGAVGE